MASGVRLTIEQQDLQLVIASIKVEADGRKLRAQLNRELKKIAEPAAAKARSNIQAMPSTDARFGDMRSAIASKVTVKVTAAGRNTGVNISAARSGYPRNFKNAPRRYNSRGWRHPVFGNRDVWVAQVGAPGWFDTVREDAPKYRAEIELALVEMALRIAARSHA